MLESHNAADTFISTINHLCRLCRPEKDTDELLESKQIVRMHTNNCGEQMLKLTTQMAKIITVTSPYKEALHPTS